MLSKTLCFTFFFYTPKVANGLHQTGKKWFSFQTNYSVSVDWWRLKNSKDWNLFSIPNPQCIYWYPFKLEGFKFDELKPVEKHTLFILSIKTWKTFSIIILNPTKLGIIEKKENSTRNENSSIDLLGLIDETDLYRSQSMLF